MNTITIPVSEAKQRFTELVKGVEEYFNRYLITKNGKEAAIVMSAEEYGNLLETLDVLANREEVKAINEASRQIINKETISLDDYLSKKNKNRKSKNLH